MFWNKKKIKEEFDVKKPLLLAGLGNIGQDYAKTRHNIGFLFADFVAGLSEQNPRFSEEKKLFGSVYKIKKINATLSQNQTTIVLKPSTMMNISGKSLAATKKYYEIPTPNIILAYDDLDIEFGKYKITASKLPRVHNGVNSVIDHLGSTKFLNIRMGIESRTNKNIPGRNFVLSNFSPREFERLSEIFAQIREDLELNHKIYLA